MDLKTITKLEETLDVVHERLLSSRGTTTLAMAALADAARTVPMFAAGLEPLMTLEQDIANRLLVLEEARELVRNIIDEDDVRAVQKQLGLLVGQELGCVPARAPRLLN